MAETLVLLDQSSILVSLAAGVRVGDSGRVEDFYPTRAVTLTS